MTEAADGRRNARFLVAYDGTDFHGFAVSAGVRTVLGDLVAAVERVTGVHVDLSGAGRTDAGVHAWGQVLTGRLPAATDLRRLTRSVNALCGPEISVRELDWAADDFDARFSATSRRYRYDVWNDAAPHPLLSRTAWHVPTPIDVDAMNVAALDLIGEHDFSSFCRRPPPVADRPPASLVRRIDDAHWAAVGDGSHLRFEIGASSFCHQMVRSIVGTLIDVGRGRLAPHSIPAILAARDRASAGRVAPPCGLVLWHVGYDGRRWDAGPSVEAVPSS